MSAPSERHWSEDTNWRRLDGVVRQLRAKVDAAIAARDEDAGQAAHDDLIRAEWRLRQAERGRR